MESDSGSFLREIVSIDHMIARLAPPIWVGAEPTFTLRTSENPEWLSEPLGGNKEQLARTLIAALRQRHPGALVLRTLGRQYAGEQKPRWSLGIYEQRDGQPLWLGPPDPLDDVSTPCDPNRLQQFFRDIIDGLTALGWKARALEATGAFPRRVLFRLDDAAMPQSSASDARFSRASVHEQAIPLTGLVDDLAAEGLYLLCIGLQNHSPGRPCLTLELPAFPNVPSFCAFLNVLAAISADFPSMILQGFPPPTDDTVAWTTVTPDPAVIEINQAPYPDSAGFLASSRELYRVAADVGLTPYRLQYNGTVTDSGGGGQYTLGGSNAKSSPFVVTPVLLPRLVRYLIQHPCLSYWFAPDYLGGSSQSPRPDEGIRELFRELRLALAQMSRRSSPEAAFIWASLAPFLSDPSGNSHRSDLNIEKFWNPHLPGRGCLGLVEFRAFRMAQTPERATAITALLRAIVAMLAKNDITPDLIDWGDELHERFALPYFLKQDLLTILADLENAGLAFGKSVQQYLQSDSSRQAWQVEFHGCRLQISRALEFWPLVGDVASQERGGSRLVDASTSRWQILLRASKADAPLAFDAWRVTSEGTEIPLRSECSAAGEVRLFGLRLREFQPWLGLHPAVRPRMPLHLTLSHPDLTEALQIVLHDWQPEGLPYAGLPKDFDDARQRRDERFVVDIVPAVTLTEPAAAPPGSLTEYSLDLRWLAD